MLEAFKHSVLCGCSVIMKDLKRTMLRFFRHSLFQQLVLILSIVGLLCFLGDWWNVYELQLDEGLNLTKAVLVAKGYHLYHEIWSDQPPLLTYTLALVHQGFPFSIAVIRTTILIFSLLLATSLFRVVLRFEGLFAAWSSVLLLVLSRMYLELSVSIMVGLPAIALAMLAIDLATLGKEKGRVLPLLAGMLFGAALLTKLFVIIILPAVMAAFWFTQKREEQLLPRASVFHVAWFFGGIVIIGGIILATIGDIPFDQLLSPHIAARSAADYVDYGGLYMLHKFIVKYAHLAFYFTVIFGLVAFLKRPASCLIIPAVWLLSGIILLATHHPLWYHQTLILVPPLSWLGGVGFKNLFWSCEPLKLGLWMGQNVDRRIVFVAVVFLVAGFVAFVRPIYKNMRHIRSYLRDNPDLPEQTARLDAAILTQGADMLITDRPILAYHTHLLVPPELAVWSEKRMKAGQLTEKEILAQVSAHPGAPVLLDRFFYDRSFLDRISSLREEVKTGFDHHGAKGIHLFLPKTARPAIEADLLSRTPELLDGGIGGVFRVDGNSIKRFARPTSKEPLPPNSVVARPPGSAQELGACFAATAWVTGSESLLIHALDVGRALYCTQTEGGGWANKAVAAGNCGKRRFIRPLDKHATFDDGTMVSILYFLFDLSDLVAESGLGAPNWLEDMIRNGLSFIVKTQSADGSWSQQYKAHRYHNLATLNDDAMTGLIRVLLVGYDRLDEPEHLEAAKRGGDFLLKAQGLGDEPAFAQQYSLLFKPASARKFEPAGYSSLETAYAINALIDLYLSTGNEQYRKGAEKAAAWLDASRITPTTWARLYEVGSNRPIFGKRDGTVTYDIADLPESERTAYRWIGGRETFPDIGVALDRISKLKEGSDAVRAYDAQFRREALLSATPTARIWLDPGQAKQHLGGRPSTRAFVEYCAGLLAASGEEVSACPSGWQKQWLGGI
jgi:PelA/Pel-15E family pectate lyase